MDREWWNSESLLIALIETLGIFQETLHPGALCAQVPPVRDLLPEFILLV